MNNDDKVTRYDFDWNYGEPCISADDIGGYVKYNDYTKLESLCDDYERLCQKKDAKLAALKEQLARAERALVRGGFVDHGAAEWKPPLGKPPVFIEVAAPPVQQPDDVRASLPTDISAQLREFAGNPGYSHNDYADIMREAADRITELESRPAAPVVAEGFPVGIAHLLAAHPVAGLPAEASREERIGRHVLDFAKRGGWKDDGEGAFEFIQRHSYVVGFEDAGGKVDKFGTQTNGSRWPISAFAPAAAEPMPASEAANLTRWHHNEFSQEMHTDPIGEYVLFADLAAPAAPTDAKPTMVCQQCGVDRFKVPCPGMADDCGMAADAHLQSVRDAAQPAPDSYTYCLSCRGEGTVRSGISEASESLCNACKGTGYDAAQPTIAVEEVRDAALAKLRDWFESQRKAISKGCGSSWDIAQCREQIEFIDAAIASTTTTPKG